jgi:DNA-binding transcriptional ArsR family regulator
MNAITQPTRLDAAFLALSNAKRRGMVETLSYRPASVSQLADEFNLSLPAIHKHVRLLEKARLIERRKAGRTNFIALDRRSLNVAQVWLNQFHTEWGSGRETLENYISSLKD